MLYKALGRYHFYEQGVEYLFAGEHNFLCSGRGVITGPKGSNRGNKNSFLCEGCVLSRRTIVILGPEKMMIGHPKRHPLPVINDNIHTHVILIYQELR